MLGFFKRIARTHRCEKWGSILRPLLLTWYACAQQQGDMELSVQLLIEMLGRGRSDFLCVVLVVCGFLTTYGNPSSLLGDSFIYSIRAS